MATRIAGSLSIASASVGAMGPRRLHSSPSSSHNCEERPMASRFLFLTSPDCGAMVQGLSLTSKPPSEAHRLYTAPVRAIEDELWWASVGSNRLAPRCSASAVY